MAIGATLAKVVQPDQLKAALKIAETQARDIQIGQPAAVDTHNGVIPGPCAAHRPRRAERNRHGGRGAGRGALPQGARPDLSVDGTIDLDRLTDVLYVGQAGERQREQHIEPVQAVGGWEIRRQTVCRCGWDGRRSTASRCWMGYSRETVVILSDMSKWDNADRLRVEQ